MQMGRWFGFRPGYRDLVRLFIGRTVGGPAGADYDMYKAFEAIVRDEQEFRNELTRFSGVKEKGEPWVTPRDVPPMVFSSCRGSDQRLETRCSTPIWFIEAWVVKVSASRCSPREATVRSTLGTSRRLHHC